MFDALCVTTVVTIIIIINRIIVQLMIAIIMVAINIMYSRPNVYRFHCFYHYIITAIIIKYNRSDDHNV